MAALCHSLGVSRSGYYAWRQGCRSSRAEEDWRLMPQVRAIFREHKRRYGARRIARELSSHGTSCGKHLRDGFLVSCRSTERPAAGAGWAV
ncbi:MAG: IS3 family transposase [Planctomycetota bacterium]